MYITFSKNFRINKLTKTERKLVRKRIAELKSCKNLGEMKYGRPHPLRAKYTGTFGIRVGKMSRLILFPMEFDPEYIHRDGKNIKYFITGVVIGYSPNHYRSYFGKNP